MGNKRLLVVTEYFWPDEAATGRFLGELVNTLQRVDVDLQVTVLTSNRLYRASKAYSLPGEESWGRTRIIRLTSHRTGSDGFLRRLWSDFVFSWQAARHIRAVRYDCLFVVTNPPVMPLVLARANRSKRKPFVYLIHDLYPDVPVALHRWSEGSLFVKLLRQWQRYTLQAAHRVIVLGSCMRDHLINRYGVQEALITAIPNWYTLDPTTLGSERTMKDPEATFDVVYSGNLGQYQDFDTLLEAAELLRTHNKIRFHIVGDGYRKTYIEQEVTRRQLQNVALLDFLPQEQFLAMLQRASMGVVTLERQLEGLGVPSKTYNLLAMGVPLLAVVGPHSEVARVIETTGCGYRFDQGESRAMADRILDLYCHPEKWAHMSSQARLYAERYASLPAVAAQYAGVLQEAFDESRVQASAASAASEHVAGDRHGR